MADVESMFELEESETPQTIRTSDAGIEAAVLCLRWRKLDATAVEIGDDVAELRRPYERLTETSPDLLNLPD